jgi:hypothetical protein
LALAVIVAAAALAGAAVPHVGESIARGKPYTLFPSPNYQHCTDSGDTTQLTDGKTTSEYFWTQKGTVGWQHAGYVAITVDLGAVEPISGVALTTAAGVAGVTWPIAIQVLVSDDGKVFRDAGDLVALDQEEHGRWPEGYAIRRLVTDELRARGRYVQFVAIPLSGGPYFFTDEVEVFRGPPALLDHQPTGPVTSAQEVYQQGRLRRAVEHRLRTDAHSIEAAIERAELADNALRRRLQQRLEEAREIVGHEPISTETDFRAVLPLGRTHARLFEVQAELWRSLDRPSLSASVPATWDPVDAFEVPPAQVAGRVEVHLMRGEYRAAAVNVFNSTDRTLEVKLRIDGLPGSPTPRCVTLHEVEWTDTAQAVPIAAALPEAKRLDDGWTVTAVPGLVRQIWLTFHVTELDPGDYSGALVAECDELPGLRIPVSLKVWPFQFPRKTTLSLGGWSYTNGSASYGVTRENRDAFLAHLQTRFVNAPWATSGVMRSFTFPDGDPNRIRLDTRAFDDWISQWPNAVRYMVFLSVAHYSGTVQSSFAGAEIGTAEFDRRVGTWISAWVRHLRTKGIPPSRLGLLIHDEPHEGSDLDPFLAWARAIKAAEPDVLIWLDPTYRSPAEAPAELFEACDVLCPNRPMWLERGEAFEQFYLDQKQRGRELQFYSCSGPGKLLDPYAYHRLQAWHAWHVGATGSFFWAFGDNSGSSSWNEYFAKAGPFTPLFLDDRTVIAGKHMEAIRESVEDFEYFVMLRKAVDRAKQAGRADANVTMAESLLTDAAGRVVRADGAGQIRWHDVKDRTMADRVRIEILEALDRLR